jgi:anti-sigma factor RsiW
MNKHEQIDKLLAGYVLGELPQQQSSQVKSHLSECRQCNAEAKRLADLLECTEQMSELSADQQSFESAKKALFETIASEQMKEPTPRPAIGPTIVWRTIMKNRITKLAAAAAIILIAALAIPFGDHLARNAYALEETFEALAQVRTVHAFCTDWDGTKVETSIRKPAGRTVYIRTPFKPVTCSSPPGKRLITMMPRSIW